MAITRGQYTGLTGAMIEDMNTMNNISVSNTGAITGTLHGAVGQTVAVNSGAGATYSTRPATEQILDRYSLNELVVEHRVQEFELMKLRETNVDYADLIKQNIAKNATQEVTRKMTFTKKHDMNSDTHSFRGRVWVFSKEELQQMIEDIRNGI